MTTGPYPVLMRAIWECGAPTTAEIEFITARIDKELGPVRGSEDVRNGCRRSTSIALAAAALAMGRSKH